MGICYATNLNVATRIAQTFPNTVKLATFAVVFAVILGLTFGVISAIKQYSFVDNVVMSISMIGISMPSFWCGLLVDAALLRAAQVASRLWIRYVRLCNSARRIAWGLIPQRLSRA